jgi:hypothetical protein
VTARDVVVMLSDLPPGGVARDGLAVVTVTFDSDQPDAQVRSGTRGTYDSLADVIVQPARMDSPDGDTVVLVLAPRADPRVATVTVDAPGGRRSGFSAPFDHRLAVAPLAFGRPEDVVGVLISGMGEASTMYPAPPMDASETWAQSPEVVASEGRGTPQVVQVRTDGQTACRMTVGSWWDGAPQLPWNAFDVACATIDREGIQLLVAEDRRYSSVAGTVPPAAVQVRLTWAGGSDPDVTTTPVRNRHSDVPVFLDESGHRPDQLVRAEALDADGNVVATALPPPPGT